MDRHLTEDELVMQHYGDLTGPDRMRIRVHLEHCPDCRSALEDIRTALALVDAADVPEPGPDFEQAMWSRIAPRLQESRQRPRRRTSWVPYAAAAGLILATAAGFWTIRTGRSAVPSASMDVTSDSRVRERVLHTALDDHFAQTQVLLVELLNAPDAETTSWTFEQTVASDLLASGRLYRTTAVANGDTHIVEILDELEPVFVEIARSPETFDRRDVDSLRARIDRDDLLFKVRAASNELRGVEASSTVNEGTL